MDESRSPLRQALRGHALFRFITLLFGFGFQVFVVKILVPEDYATYAVLVATLLVGERLLSFGLDRTVYRFVPGLILGNDRSGLWFLATRLGLLRLAGLLGFALIVTSTGALQLITPGHLSATATLAFGCWFLAYALYKDADAITQGLIAHHWAARVAASEAFLRLGALSLLYLVSRVPGVETVVIVYAITSSGAAACLLYLIRRAARRRQNRSYNSITPPIAAATVRREVPGFAAAAYASTLSYLISSPGVIRLVATTGLGVNALAAFSFVQSVSTSLASALPGQLILPSLESVGAKLAASGSGERILPGFSLLFKIELTFILSIIIATTIAGPDLIRILSRPAYGPYYYILPILMVGVSLQTIYRMLEILGSVNLKYRIFLALWPLSVGAMVVLYFAVGRWGLISVLAVPLIEIAARVGTVAWVLRRYGIRKVLDPVRSLRLIGSALIVLSCASFALGTQAPLLRFLVAAVGVIVFLSTLLVIRPVGPAEYDILSKSLPVSWTLPRFIGRRLSRAG